MGLPVFLSCFVVLLVSLQPTLQDNKFGVPEGNLWDVYKNTEGKKLRLLDLKYESCGGGKDKLHLKELQIKPTANGDKLVNFVGSTDVNLASPIKMDLSVQKKMLGVWVTVPCINNVGTCHYDDLCEFGFDKCPFKVLDDNKIPCKCPIAKGTYSIKNGVIPLPRLPTADLLAGEYMGKVVVFNAQNEQLACYNGTATVGVTDV